MDKQQYIASVRELGKKYERIQARRGLLLSLLHSPHLAVRAIAKVNDQYVRELWALEPPPGDAEDLERGFLNPVEEKVRKASARATTHRHWWQKQGTPEQSDYQSELDLINFCVSYGIVDNPDWKPHATYQERVRNVGLIPPMLTPPHRELSERQRQHLRWPWTPFSVGKSLAKAITSHPEPTSGVGLPKHMMFSWVYYFVASDAPDVPVGALLTKAPPRRWRGHPTFVTIHGDPRPGGMFAVEFPDGAVRVSRGRASLALWPPKPLRKVFGVIVG
jgi:hypothetical protein